MFNNTNINQIENMYYTINTKMNNPIHNIKENKIFYDKHEIIQSYNNFSNLKLNNFKNTESEENSEKKKKEDYNNKMNDVSLYDDSFKKQNKQSNIIINFGYNNYQNYLNENNLNSENNYNQKHFYTKINYNNNINKNIPIYQNANDKYYKERDYNSNFYNSKISQNYLKENNNSKFGKNYIYQEKQNFFNDSAKFSNYQNNSYIFSNNNYSNPVKLNTINSITNNILLNTNINSDSFSKNLNNSLSNFTIKSDSISKNINSHNSEEVKSSKLHVQTNKTYGCQILHTLFEGMCNFLIFAKACTPFINHSLTHLLDDLKLSDYIDSYEKSSAYGLDVNFISEQSKILFFNKNNFFRGNYIC